MGLVILLLVGQFLSAQTSGRVKVSVSLQPLETFKGVFQQPIKGVALYEILACNVTDTSVTFGNGHLLQGLADKLNLVSHATLSPTMNRGRQKTWTYKAAQIGEWAAWAVTLVMAANVVSASAAVKAVFPLVAQTSTKIKGSMDAQDNLLKELAPMFLDPVQVMTLGGYACDTRLVMGDYKNGFKDQFWIP